MTKLGARVVVAPDDAAAVEVAHPALPVPTMTPAPQETAKATDDAQMKAELVATVQPAAGGAGFGGAEAAQPAGAGQDRQDETRADAIAKAKAAKEAVATSA